MVMPVIGSRLVPIQIRLLVAWVTSLITVPLLPPIPDINPLSPEMLVVILQELGIGITIGFAFQVAFQVFVLSGQYMAMKMGLGFASLNDPTNGVQTTVLSQFFLTLVTLMFVTIDGHLILIELIVASFVTLPLGASSFDRQIYFELVQMGSWMFSAALVFALPVLTSLLFVNIAFGVMSRAAPQLNIFAVGFPFTLISGIVLIYIGLINFDDSFNRVMEYAFVWVRQKLELL